MKAAASTGPESSAGGPKGFGLTSLGQGCEDSMGINARAWFSNSGDGHQNHSSCVRAPYRLSSGV